jgi:hypothetical protein
MALNLTTVGTVVGFVLTKHSTSSLLLLVPVISPTLGLQWLDHNRNIGLLASYVRTELWIWKPSWEAWYDRQRAPGVSVLYFGSITLIYGGGGVATLVLAWPSAKAAAGVWVLALLGAVLLAAFFAYLFATVVTPRISATRRT